MPRPPKYIAVAAAHRAPAPPRLHVGTSGWAYPTWKPEFYPAEVPSRAFLHFYASKLTAVEVNYTFRMLPTPAQLAGWLGATPAGFHFSFKAPQRITHFARLRECGDEVDRFLTSIAPARAAGKLGPVLFQLPPNFQASATRLLAFLQLPSLRVQRIAFEFRHPSWFCEEIYEILRQHRAVLCVADTDELTTPDVPTGDFRCYRLRRDGGYSEAELRAFADRFSALAQDKDTFVFFRHQEEPTGALNAKRMLDEAVTLVKPGHGRKTA